MRVALSAALAAAGFCTSVMAQPPAPAPTAPIVVPAAEPTAPVTAPAARVTLPTDTILQVASVTEISSINMKIGDTHKLQVAADVAYNGVVLVPRGAPVLATITYRTGKGIGGKSAKFELTFSTVTVNGTAYKLKGKHRQEGRGNTVGALLGSMFITGKSAVITSGQVLTAFTDEPIPVA